jgi:hypothetical protein
MVVRSKADTLRRQKELILNADHATLAIKRKLEQMKAWKSGDPPIDIFLHAHKRLWDYSIPQDSHHCFNVLFTYLNIPPKDTGLLGARFVDRELRLNTATHRFYLKGYAKAILIAQTLDEGTKKWPFDEDHVLVRFRLRYSEPIKRQASGKARKKRKDAGRKRPHQTKAKYRISARRWRGLTRAELIPIRPIVDQINANLHG